MMTSNHGMPSYIDSTRNNVTTISC